MSIDELKKEAYDYLLLILKNKKTEIKKDINEGNIDQEEGSLRLQWIFLIEHAVSRKKTSTPTTSKLPMGAYNFLGEMLYNAEEENKVDIVQDADKEGALQRLKWIELIKVAIIDLAED